MLLARDLSGHHRRRRGDRLRPVAIGGYAIRVAIVVLSLYAALKLGDEFRRLLFQSDRLGAIDLGILQRWTKDWAAGVPIYGPVKPALYPPTSFVMLWPLMGWLDFNSARWLWAATTLAVLVWMAFLIIRESGATSRSERVFVALMLLSMNATGVTVGNGQLVLHILPVLLAGVLWLRESERLERDLAASLCIIAALVKPNITAPFLWLVVVAPRRMRPVLMIIAGYLALTLVATQFQGGDLLAMMRASLEGGVDVATRGGYANLGFWLGNAGMKAWILPAGLAAFLTLGVWIYRHRQIDLWILLGVTALVARLWTYHRVYDDVLIIFVEVALFRIAKRRDARDGSAAIAGVLLGVTIFSMLFLASWEHADPPLNWIFAGGHTVVWIADLIFLLVCAWRWRKLDGAADRIVARA